MKIVFNSAVRQIDFPLQYYRDCTVNFKEVIELIISAFVFHKHGDSTKWWSWIRLRKCLSNLGNLDKAREKLMYKSIRVKNNLAIAIYGIKWMFDQKGQAHIATPYGVETPGVCLKVASSSFIWSVFKTPHRYRTSRDIYHGTRGPLSYPQSKRTSITWPKPHMRSATGSVVSEAIHIISILRSLPRSRAPHFYLLSTSRVLHALPHINL